ncbi:MAG: cysteine desulfurase family protein [Patescibacteria group bacterium]
MKAYLDCAASTPVDDKVLRAMKPYFSEKYGNPGSLHSLGQEAQAGVDMARKSIADYFGVDFTDVIFTASATEANNLAIQGTVRNWELEIGNSGDIPHIITSKIEHASVLEPCRVLEKQGLAQITYLDVDKNGAVDLDHLKKSLKKETVLVSIMQVNNETGAIQPIQEIAEIIKQFKQDKLKPENQRKYQLNELIYPFFHTDAAQGLGHLKQIKLAELGVDLMTVSGHKIYGPKGVGVLISNFQFPISNSIQPMFFGGMQEFGLRGSTENVPAIIGFAKAIELADKFLNQNSNQILDIKNVLIKNVKKVYPRAVVNSPESSIAEILNISLPDFKSEELIYQFDRFGIAVSGGAACEAKALKSSHVLKAMGLSENLLNSAIRFSFGRKTNQEEINYFLSCLPKIFSK